MSGRCALECQFQPASFSEGQLLHYMLYLPPRGEVSETPLPLLLYLHGASGRSDDGLRGSNLRSYGIPLALEALGVSGGGGNGERDGEGIDGGAAMPFPFGVLAPVCPRSLRAQHTATSALGTLEWKSRSIAAAVEELLQAVLRCEEPSRGGGVGGCSAGGVRFDATRVWLTGMSMGGLGAFTLGAEFNRRSPPTFAAVVPICGGGRPLFAPLLARTPVWFFHAANDNAIAVSETDALVTAIRKAAAAAAAVEGEEDRGDAARAEHLCRYTRFERLDLPCCFAPFEGHNSWDDAYACEELWSWLLMAGGGGGANAALVAAAAAATAATYRVLAYAQVVPSMHTSTM